MSNVVITTENHHCDAVNNSVVWDGVDESSSLSTNATAILLLRPRTAQKSDNAITITNQLAQPPTLLVLLFLP